MLYLIAMTLMSKETVKIADNYYKMVWRGKSDDFYVANVIKGNVNDNACEIPILNLRISAEGKVEECIYKPTKNTNEFEVVIYYRR